MKLEIKLLAESKTTKYYAVVSKLILSREELINNMAFKEIVADRTYNLREASSSEPPYFWYLSLTISGDKEN